MLKDFRTFILRGNVVDLAVAVVIGAAFGAVVTSLVKDMITPIVGALVSNHSFASLTFTVHGSKFLYGDFVNAVVAFLLIATVVFFFVVQPINKLQKISASRKSPEDTADRNCPECLSEIPKAATRCRFCTAKVAAVIK